MESMCRPAIVSRCYDFAEPNCLTSLRSERLPDPRSVLRKRIAKMVRHENPTEFYEFDTEIFGSGATGSIYVVRNREHGVRRAVKRISLDKSYVDIEKGTTELQMISSELQILNFLREHPSPHIVQFYEVFEHENDLFIFMELMSGDLYAVTNGYIDEPIPESIIAHLARGILKGLQHLHENGIIHRDIKPENVLWNQQGEVKLINFGLSKLVGRKGGLALSKNLGTPIYMSPKVIHLNPDEEAVPYDDRVDFWSLGVMISEMAMGHDAYIEHNDDPDFNITVMRHVSIGHRVTIPLECGRSFPLRKFVNTCLGVIPVRNLSASNLLKAQFITSQNQDLEGIGDIFTDYSRRYRNMIAAEDQEAAELNATESDIEEFTASGGCFDEDLFNLARQNELNWDNGESDDDVSDSDDIEFMSPSPRAHLTHSANLPLSAARRNPVKPVQTAVPTILSTGNDYMAVLAVMKQQLVRKDDGYEYPPSSQFISENGETRYWSSTDESEEHHDELSAGNSTSEDSTESSSDVKIILPIETSHEESIDQAVPNLTPGITAETHPDLLERSVTWADLETEGILAVTRETTSIPRIRLVASLDPAALAVRTRKNSNRRWAATNRNIPRISPQAEMPQVAESKINNEEPVAETAGN